MTNDIFRPFIAPYFGLFDDIFVFGMIWDEHFQHFEQRALKIAITKTQVIEKSSYLVSKTFNIVVTINS